MNIRLTNKERESLEWLQHFTNQLLQGEPVEYTKPVVDQLRKMGIDVGFVSHKEVATLVRGKEAHFSWLITNAPWYIRGSTSKRYLPFQIKERRRRVEY